jgi:preprotein translocase subunit SecA
MAFSITKFFGDGSGRYIKALNPIVEKIDAFENSMQGLGDADFAEKTTVFRERLSGGETLDDILPEAFAAVREASRRLSGERHYAVQLMGGIVLHRGDIAEMRTGEGKTLVATLPVYLNALEGKGVHVVTVNDYLSRRDAVWMGQIYSFLGMSVGVINNNASYIYDSTHKEDSTEDEARDATGSFKVQYDFLRPVERKEAYLADITYGTNNEFGFDHLRDNLVYDTKDLRQRGYNFAIVDEIDSILIDEARTPLIISAPAEDSENLYAKFSHIVRNFETSKDFEVDEKHKAITLTDSGIEKAEAELGIGNIYTDAGIKLVHHLENAVRAKALYRKDKEYVVREGEVVIVDEFTGRLQPGRRWSEGLHQAIEAKEGVVVQKESRTYASITFQNYFRMYDKLAGMTGTALTSSEEFHTVYGLDVVAVPTNKPSARDDNDDLIFRTEHGKFLAIARSVKSFHEKGQPVLIGTVSIEKNEQLAEYLRKENIPHEILNAKNHEREGEIIAQAGQKGRVTIATNMAGRGVDIKLGGNPAPEGAYEMVKSLGGLAVIGTERHEARRIDNQLRGRSGRQGDPGHTQFFVSLEDSLMRVFASDTLKSVMGRLNIPEDEPIYNKIITRSLEKAQEKIEGFHFDSRKHVLAYDNVLNHQRGAVYEKRNKFLLDGDDGVNAYLSELTEGDEEFTSIVAQKKEILGEEEFLQAVCRLGLQVIDMLWIEHLEVMNYLRSSVNLRAYGQRDPLIEYRKEGLRLFRELEESIDETFMRMFPNIGVGAFVKEQRNLNEVHAKAQALGGGAEGIQAGALPAHAVSARSSKVGRNEVVIITNGTETKEIKYKKAEELLKSGEWKLVERV